MIAGVCAGIAEYFGWEVTLFRVVFVLVSILSVAFPGILVYLVLWVVMPQPESLRAFDARLRPRVGRRASPRCVPLAAPTQRLRAADASP